MKLSDYMKTIEKDRRSIACRMLSKELEVSTSSIYSWMNGTRSISPKNALKLEKITRGVVSRHDSRPDIYPIDEL